MGRHAIRRADRRRTVARVDSPTDDRSPVVWRPDDELLHDSNVGALHGGRAHRRLRRRWCARSIDEPEWFWDAVVRFLGVPFDAPYEPVLDTSAGIPWATWFVGGQCNARDDVRRSRLPTPTRAAIVWEGEDGVDPHACRARSCAR